MERARHEGDRAPSVGQRAKLTRAPSGDGGRQAPQRAGTAKRPEEAPGAPAEPGRLRRSQDNRLSDDSPRGGVQAAEAEAGGVALGVGVGVGHDVSDELEVPGAAPAPQGGRGAGASAHHREAGDRVRLDGDHLVGVVAHGAGGDIAEPLDLGLGVAGHVGQDAVVGEQRINRLGVTGDHGVTQERVEVCGRMRSGLGGVGMGVEASLGTGQGTGLVGTVGAATHGSRVEPDVGQTRDQLLSARVTGAQVPPHLRLQPVSRCCTRRLFA